ncbi:MAG: alpha/beta hydrolase [Planctomycetota bacterium]
MTRYAELSRRWCFLMMLLLVSSTAAGDNTHADATAPTQDPILLWPDDPKRNAMSGIGEMVKRDDGKTQVTEIKTPHLIPYLVKDADEPRPAVILCPGGGYKKLVPSLHWPIAEWLNEQGFHAFILMYRCPSSRNGGAVPDLQRAIRMVRGKADDWQIDSDKIGVLGTSAGGNLCARGSIGFGRDKYKPTDAMDKLSGGTQTPSDWVQVPEDTPPTLIITAKDDKGHYANSPTYEAALKAANVPVTAYYYETGGHGFGMDQPATRTWPDRMLKWLIEQGVIDGATPEQ